MPHVDNEFVGHMFGEDPRNLCTAAHSCTWPTLPAYRWQFDCPNASGLYTFFRILSPLVELTSSLLEHDFGDWNLVGAQPPFDLLLLRKLPIDTEDDGFQFTLTFKMSFDPGTYNNDEIFPSGKCNVNYDLPNWNQGGAPVGSLGDNAILRQVVWDEASPPP